jgi:glycerol-3-phosphate dehydrogenase
MRDWNLGKGHPDRAEDWRRRPFESPWYRRHISRGMAALSREALVDDSIPGLLSIYGGKFTTYRSLSERVGDRIGRRLGILKPSRTGERHNWFLDDLPTGSPLLQSQPALRTG